MRFFSHRILPPLIVFVIACFLWDAALRIFQIPRYLLPSPIAVYDALSGNLGNLLVSTWATAQAALLGFAASMILGIAAAIVLSSSSLVRRGFYPYTVFFQTVPIIAIAPLLVLWFNPGLPSVAVCAFIVSVFPVITSTLSGLLSTDPALLDLFQLYGAGRPARFFKLRLPSSLPNIISGLRVAAGLSVIGTVVSEFLVGLIGEGEGLGVRIISANKNGKSDLIFAAVLLTCLLGLAMFGAVNLAGRLLMRRWHASEKD